ncbi:MAG: hypothetical protein ACI8TX_000893 [Hyphomicrobiaceae bacterium]|jgi:uncharacterized protein (TIGR00730 family)
MRLLIDQLVLNVVGLVAEHPRVADVKLVASAVAEIRQGLAALKPYPTLPKVTVFGSARTAPEDPLYKLAVECGRLLAEAGFMVITGAGPGIMAAAHEGAGRALSFGVGIRLPFEQHPNAVMVGNEKLVEFKYFFTRKLFFLKEASAVIVFPGGFGTHDEAFETLTLIQTGKTPLMPVILVDRPGSEYWKAWDQFVKGSLLVDGYISGEDDALYRITDDPADAVAEVKQFYRVYHSTRVIRGRTVLRIRRSIENSTLVALSEEFADILGNTPIRSSEAFREEADEPEFAHLHRLVLEFDRHGYGRLRTLIDRLNALDGD